MEDGQICLYSYSFENSALNTAYATCQKLEPNYESRRKNFCLVRLLPFAKKDLLVASDLLLNIHFYRISNDENCLAKPFHIIFNSHAKFISDLVFISVPVPLIKNQSADQQSGSVNYIDY